MPGRAEAPGRVRTRNRVARPDAQVTPGPKCGGHPTPYSARPARVPGAAAVAGRRDVRQRDVHRSWRRGSHGLAHTGGDYVRIDFDEPEADCRLVAVRNLGRGWKTVVRLLVEREGRRILRALDERCPELPVDAGNETDIRGVVVLVQITV